MEEMLKLMKQQIKIQLNIAGFSSVSLKQQSMDNYVHSLQAEAETINAILQNNKSGTGDREMKLYDRLYEIQHILRTINSASV